MFTEVNGLLTMDALAPILADEGIFCAGIVPLAACRRTRQYLLERAGLSGEAGSVLMLALPYRVGGEAKGNLSTYAVSVDYHRVAAELFAWLLPRLEAAYPGAKFAGFADHSPIDERHAAAIAGLGCIGDNGLLITARYGSYVFLAEIITDLPTDALPCPVAVCDHCGACRAACPVQMDGVRCLSALTQKKGELTADEAALIVRAGMAWGCDVCQDVCPRNRGVDCAPLPTFVRDRVPTLTLAALAAMDDAAFARRAYAWRGRAVIARNLRLLEGCDV